jgi:gas vesicle protein
MNSNVKTQDFILGTLVGSAIGALTVALFTTQKGKQIREEIASKYHEFEDRAKGVVENVKSGAQQVANELKEGDD